MAARILLVEDDPTVRESLRNLLSVAGYEMSEASTLRSLQDCLLEPAPQVLLLDLHLPDGHGLSALPDVKKNWPGCKVVILTGDGSLKATEDVYKFDDVFLLSKPLDPEMLESVLEMALMQHAGAA
jgi:DNA-binding NtrC family response regulator